MPDRTRRQPGDPDSVLGHHLRRLRINAGLSQEEFAERVSALGWGGATVAKLESGDRSLKASELLVLLEEVPDIVTISRPDAPKGIRAWDVLEAHRRLNREARTPDVERRAAQTLGVTVDALQGAALRLWKTDLSAERSRRLANREAAGQPSGRGAAGRVSRELVSELRQELAKKGTKR